MIESLKFFIKSLTSVRMEGIEPTCLAAPDPKSGASASFATSAMGRKNKAFL